MEIDDNKPIEEDDKFIVALMDEVEFFVDKLRCDDTQEFRRTLCRSVFQFVDGAATILKKDIAYHESPALIGDDIYYSCLDKKVKSKSNTRKLIIQKRGFADNLYFAFDIYGLAAGVDLDIKEDQNEWQRFKFCISIRNRVVHPKSLSDLKITEDEVSEMVNMYLWLKNRLIKAHHECAMSYLKQANALRKNSKTNST